mmetsp:Transcript_20635/g.42081  ORF Transcript_20635/g.42081 Transcript_20635/m.42081 type:complete len:387 (-) Transcript_20635:1006-2166(-)
MRHPANPLLPLLLSIFLSAGWVVAFDCAGLVSFALSSDCYYHSSSRRDITTWIVPSTKGTSLAASLPLCALASAAVSASSSNFEPSTGGSSSDGSNTKRISIQSRDDIVPPLPSYRPTTTPKPILVIGATGRLGSRIVSKLSQRNIPYRARVRPSSTNFDRIGYLSGGRIYEGDLIRYHGVRAAVCGEGGIGGCVCVSGSLRRTRLGDWLRLRWLSRGRRRRVPVEDTDHPYVVHHVGMQNLCRAIHELNDAEDEDEDGEEEGGVKIVKVSGVLLSLPRWHYVSWMGNMLYSGVMKWHRTGEEDIMGSGIRYTILRPGSFRNDEEYEHVEKELVVTRDGALSPGFRVKKPRIGIDDLADLCIDCLQSRSDIDDEVLYPKWEETPYI